MQIFPKTKCFCNKHGPFRKNSLFSIKTTFAFLEKNSIPETWVLEKKMIFGRKKIETPGPHRALCIYLGRK